MTWADKFVAFDTETTGLDEKARIVEIACVLFEGGEVKEEWSSLVRPIGVDWEDKNVPQALEVNKINPKDLENKPTFIEVFHRIFMSFRSSPVWVAHNAEFDIRMLDQEFLHHRGVDFLLKPKYCLCTKLLSRKIHPSEKSHRLQDVGPRWNVVNDNAHRASSDAITCGRILAAMSKNGHLPGDIGQVHELQKAASSSWPSRKR